MSGTPERKERVELDPKTKAVFDRKGYEVLDKISQGAFGKVYKARKTDGTMSAVKVMEIAKMPPKFVKEFLPRELDMLQRIRHPYVLNVFDIFRSKGKYWIFMEFAPNGVLTKRCIEQPIPEHKAKKWFRQCTQALDYMHYELHVCHRDIKTDNVLLDAKDDAKLSDFGFARELAEENGMTGTVCGTLPYYSPELLRSGYKKTPYGAYHADCWAMGVMLFVMLTSKWPYKFAQGSKKKTIDELRAMIQAQFDRDYQEKPNYQNLSEPAKDLIDHLLEPSAKKRFTTKQILKHPWIGSATASATSLTQDKSYTSN